jgi:vitamin B12 transporter
MRRVFLPVVPLLLVRSLCAQDAPPPAPPRAETIVVTADRTPQPLGYSTDAVTVIGAEELRASQAPTVVDALREVAGLGLVQSGSAGHTASLFLRGANPAQVLVLVDGVDVNNPFFGGVDLSSILTSGVERIEIVRGPQSTLYGSDAMAGVVNIITGVSHEGRLGEGAFEGGSLSTFRENVQLGAKKGPLAWSLTGARNDTGGQFPNDEFHATQLTGRLRRELGTGSALTVSGFFNDARIGIPFNGATPSPDRKLSSSLGVAGATYELHAWPLLNLEAHASFTRRTDDFHDPDDAFSQRSHDLSTIWRAGVQDLAVIGAHAVTFGFEYQSQDVSATSNGDPALDRTIATSSVYAQDRIEHGALALSLGARFDHHGAFGGRVSPRLSAAYRLSPAWRLRIGGGTAFRAPSVGELSYPYYGNPALEPETSRSYEGGVDFSAGSASASVTAFHTTYRGLITFDPTTFVAANIDRATIRGVEVTAGERLGAALRVDATYTLLDTRDDGRGAPLYRRPRHSGSLAFGYASGSWSARVAAHLFGPRLERDFEASVDRENGGYVKVDLSAGYRVSPRLRLTARLENALDRRYEEALGFRAPGRTFFGGVELGF